MWLREEADSCTEMKGFVFVRRVSSDFPGGRLLCRHMLGGWTMSLRVEKVMSSIRKTPVPIGAQDLLI